MTATATKASSKPKYTKRDYEADLVNGLIELMEQGTNPWQRDWRGSTKGGHRNLISGHNYTGSNPALLELQMMLRGSDLPLWLPSKGAKDKGWYPRKGSKSCCIIMPFKYTKELKDEHGKPVVNDNGDPETVPGMGFKYTGKIFNVADMQGDGLDEAVAAALDNGPEERTEPERHEAAEAVLGNWEVPVRWMGNSAKYSGTSDTITLPPRDSFKSAEGLYGTWAHEVVHSTGHQDRLARDGIVNFAGYGTDSYAKEELVAELGAFLVCNRLEVSSRAENHASYLHSWIKCLKEKPSYLKKALSDANKAANHLVPQVHDDD